MAESLFSPIPLTPTIQGEANIKRIARGYAIALLSVGAAFLIRMALQPLLGHRAPHALCHPAILVAACYGGWGPSLFALVLSAFGGDFLFEPPTFSTEMISPDATLRTGLFLTSGLIIAILGGSLKHARRKAEFNTQELERQAIRFRDSEERYRRMFETAYEGIWCLNAEYQTSYVNGRMVDMLGYSIIGMVGHLASDFVFPEDRSRLETILERRRQGGKEVFDFRFRRKDGSAAWCIVSTQSIIGKDGKFDGSLQMVTDITARLLTAEDLNHTLDVIKSDVQTIESLHRSVLTRVEAVLENMPADEPNRLALEAIRNTAIQAADAGQHVVSSLRSRRPSTNSDPPAAKQPGA